MGATKSTAVPPVDLSFYISETRIPDDDVPGWLESQQPCGSGVSQTLYPDHDGSTRTSLCGGVGRYLYVINNTQAEDQLFYLIMAQVTVVGPVEFHRVSQPHPERIATSDPLHHGIYGTGPWKESIGEPIDEKGFDGIYGNYYQQSFEDHNHKLDPRWTAEKGLDPQFAQYFESGNEEFYESAERAAADLPPDRLVRI